MLVSVIFYFLLFCLGASVGSFLNVLADRLPFDRPIANARSICEYCKKFLTPSELIPLVSFVLQSGRCTKCKKQLSYYYPLSELVTGVMFVGTAYYADAVNAFAGLLTGSTVATNLSVLTNTLLLTLYLWVVFSIYLAIFLTDLKHRIIPDVLIIVGIVFVSLFTLATGAWQFYTTYKMLLNSTFGHYLIKAGYAANELNRLGGSLLWTILSSVALFVFFYLLIVATKGRGMGGGDMKLAFLIGIFNGFPGNIIGVFLGFLIGSVYSLLLIGLFKKSIKDTIPFGPFLILGSVGAYFYGNELLGWYLRLPTLIF